LWQTAQLTRLNAFPWLCHIAESAEELQAFSEQSGDLYFHITRKQPWPYGDNPMGSMNYAVSQNLIPHGGICMHCNYVSGHELALLAAKRISIGIAMQYTLYNNHKPFPIDSALKRGLNLCIATETTAFFPPPSLFDELFCVKKRHPHIPAADLFRMVTVNPARALNALPELGTLTGGKKADIIGVGISPYSTGDPLEEAIMSDPEILFVMVDGEEILVRS